jgi:drug/metabolite transporter (DMT)-like permease
VAIVLGLIAALTYGTADFLGGFATKRSSVFSVVVISQTFGSLVILAALPFFSDGYDSASFAWGMASGVAGGLGVTFFYAALATGRMSQIAPVTAVEAACVPVIFGLVSGERPGLGPLIGIALALVAVALVSSGAPDAEPSERDDRRGLLLALGAGIGFGLFFVLLGQAGHSSALWPLAGARVASISSVLLIALVARRPLRPSPGSLLVIAGAGVFDVAANLAYLLASRVGLLSLVAVVTSMYPAMTVMLARVVLHERMHRTQILGVAAATAAVTLIALG